MCILLSIIGFVKCFNELICSSKCLNTWCPWGALVVDWIFSLHDLELNKIEGFVESYSFELNDAWWGENIIEKNKVARKKFPISANIFYLINKQILITNKTDFNLKKILFQIILQNII